MRDKVAQGEKNDRVHISGSGRISGGNFEKLIVTGSGTVTGRVNAEEITVSGSAKFKGDVKCEDLTVTGSAGLAGCLSAGKIVSRGSLQVEKTVESSSIKSYGSLDLGQDLRSNDIYLAGSSSIAGDVEGERFASRGGFSIEGLLTADEIEIWLGSKNFAREIGGERISITKKAVSLEPNEEKVKQGIQNLERGLQGLGDRLGFELELDEERISSGVSNVGRKVSSYINDIGKGSLQSRIIEGDEIELEGVEAEIVRGEKLVIGRDCLIDKAEYSDTIEVEEGAEPGEKVKI